MNERYLASCERSIGRSRALLHRFLMGSLRIALPILFLPFPVLLWSQQSQPSLSPSEAYRAAMDPFSQARAQVDDLTDADRLALSLGMVRASSDCISLKAAPEGFVHDAAQLMALGRLCLFGRQFEPARTTLLEYLALASPTQRELGLVLLVRAFLGLNDPYNAHAQVRSLLSDYPYDTQIHFAADQVISATEGMNPDFTNLAMELCAKQRAATLPLLENGKALTGTDGDAPASTLYADALRCETLARSIGDHSANDTMEQLRAIVGEPIWEKTAEYAPMQEGLARAETVGQPSPLNLLHAREVHAIGPLPPRTLPLTEGTVLLVPVTLWSPSASSFVRDIARSSPRRTIYAVTSWSANTGGQDSASAPIAEALRTWRQSLPAHVSLLIVPDAELRAFHASQYPAGIAIQNGKVTFNAALTDEGAVRMMLGSVQAGISKP